MADTIDPIRQLVEAHGRDLAFVVNHSGGKDSTRMLGFVRQLFPYTTMYGVMADTGFEHKTPISAMDCTDSARRTWSRGPIDKFIRALPQKALISCLGIRQKNRARAQSSHLGK